MKSSPLLDGFDKKSLDKSSLSVVGDKSLVDALKGTFSPRSGGLSRFIFWLVQHHMAECGLEVKDGRIQKKQLEIDFAGNSDDPVPAMDNTANVPLKPKKE